MQKSHYYQTNYYIRLCLFNQIGDLVQNVIQKQCLTP